MTQYYVRFTDQLGNVIAGDAAGSQWFEVADPYYGGFQTLNIGSQSIGLGAGRVGPVPLTLTLGASTLTEKIDRALEAGYQFNTIELVGYDQTGAGPVKVSSTVFKTAGAFNDAIDVLTGTHTLSFLYGGVVESVAKFNDAGQVTGAATAGWDLIHNAKDDSTTFDAQQHAGDPFADGVASTSIVPEATQDHRVYLQIRNFNGTPLTGLGSNWIEVDAATASQLQFLDIGGQSTGIGAQKVVFDPLNLVMKPGALSPLLDQIMAQGKPLQIELAVYGTTGGGNVLLDDYQFGRAGLKTSSLTNGTHSYSLEYGSERMAHYVYDPSGAYVRTEVEGWDRVKNVIMTQPGTTPAGVDAQKAPITEGGISLAAPQPEATQYYVRFTDNQGHVLTGDTATGQWFAVSDASFSSEQLLAIGAASTGLGAGAVTLNPLTLTVGASSLTEKIDHALKAGLQFNTIELVGYADTGGGLVKVSSTVFNVAGAASDTITPTNGAHALSFQYGGLVESLATFDSSGAVTGTVTAGWNRIRNVADNSTTFDAHVRPDDPLQKGVATDKVVPAAIQDHQVFLQIRNLDGTPLAGLDHQWVKVDAAIVDQLQYLSIGSQSTGIGAGKVTYDPLKLTFEPGTLSPALDKAMAQGTPFQVELAVYGDTGAGSVLLDDYQFGMAGLDLHTFKAGQHSYSFEYASERTAHSVFNVDGTLVRTEVEGWDRTPNVNLTSPSGRDSSFDAQQAPASQSGIVQFTTPHHATQFYVRLTDANGAVIHGDGGKSQWFAVSDPTYSGDQTLNIGSQSTGLGAGSVNFDGLSFTLAASSLTEKIDQAVENGQPFQTIELVGYDESGDTPLKVTSTVFKLAGASTDQIDAVTGAHKVTFEYGTLVESHATFDQAGLPTGAVTKGWNDIRTVADDSTTYDATQHATDPYVGGSATGTIETGDFSDKRVYLQIRNNDGTPLTGLGSQWIEVDSATVGQFQTLDLHAASGGTGAGKVTFDPLTLVFDPDFLAPMLDQYMALGNPLQIELAVYGRGAAAGQLVDDYQFGLAGLETHAVVGRNHVYTLEYGSERMAHSVYASDGSFVRTDVEGWNRVKNVQLTSPELPLRPYSVSFDPQKAPRSEDSLSIFGYDTPFTITAEDFTPSQTTLHAGGTVSFTLTMSEAATATKSYLQLSNGAKAKFDAVHSTATSLVYTYTVTKADAASTDLQALSLVGTIKNASNSLLDNTSFALIDTKDLIDPNNPATIGGRLTGKVAVGGIDSVAGKLRVTDLDRGEAGVQAQSLTGKFGTFAITAAGAWEYRLTDSAAAAAAKATGLSMAESFHVLSIDGSASADVVVNVVMPAHPGPLAFTGTAKADALYGGGDGDTLSGLAGNDSLFGLGGDDILLGGPGDDVLNGGLGFDTASYADASSAVAVALTRGPQNTGGGGIDTLIGIEKLVGSDFADKLVGNSAGNSLAGRAGDDLLNGGKGADLMDGGAGNDIYIVDNAGDSVLETLDGGTDTIRTSVSYTISPFAENMELVGAAKISGTGNQLANIITGNKSDNVLVGLGGQDSLTGGDGNDTLSGGAGADILTGGPGKDTFLFDTLPVKSQQDKILDFAAGEDKIAISRSVFAAFADHAASEFNVGDIAFGTKAQFESQYLIYNAVKGALYYDDDGTGAHAPVLIAALSGAPQLSLADFVLV